MAHITFDYSKVLDKFVAPHEVDNLQAQVTVADEMIRKGTGPGADFLGWRDLPENYDREEFDRILKAAEKIKEESDVLVVIGIGGSYLGAKAAIDFLNHHFANFQTKEERKAPQIVYAGNSISSTYLADLLEYVENKDFSVNVISKSGTTTVKKKQTNVSTQQLTAKKVQLKLKQMLTVGKLSLFQMTSVDVSQY